MTSKYGTSELIENQFEPGSRKQVLKNLMGIKIQRKMDKIEAVALKQAEDLLFRAYSANRRFTADDLCKIHRVWLGRIYPWAGKYRNVDLVKKDFRFAHAKYIPLLMTEFERSFLDKLTPCDSMSNEKLAEALAKVHAEFILIHPFREGNGRVGRVLATLMAAQAGFPPLNFKIIEKRMKRDYILAVQASLGQDYAPMKKIFRLILEQTNPGEKDR